MACGCPVVASRIPSSVEVAGEAPWYFTAGQPGELVAALDAAMGRDPARLQAGLDRARQFSWDGAAAGTLAVYRELSGTKGI